MFAQDENDVGMRNIRIPQIKNQISQDREQQDFKV